MYECYYIHTFNASNVLKKEIQTCNLNFLYRKYHSTQSESPTQNNLILQCDLFFRPHKGGVGCEKTGFECRINAYNSRFKKGLVSQIEKFLLMKIHLFERARFICKKYTLESSFWDEKLEE